MILKKNGKRIKDNVHELKPRMRKIETWFIRVGRGKEEISSGGI